MIDWLKILDPSVPSDVAYESLGQAARRKLMVLPPGDTIGTTDLVEHLFPADIARKSDAAAAARKRMFKAFTMRALGMHGLADCVTQGEQQVLGRYKQIGRPLLWHRPIDKKCCPTCGQELALAGAL